MFAQTVDKEVKTKAHSQRAGGAGIPAESGLLNGPWRAWANCKKHTSLGRALPLQSVGVTCLFLQAGAFDERAQKAQAAATASYYKKASK